MNRLTSGLPVSSTQWSSSSEVPHPRSMPTRRRARTTTYTHTFCCLSDKSASEAPSRLQKSALVDAGLGEKRLTFSGRESSPYDFLHFIFQHYPRLSEAGGFELLRIAGKTRSRRLTLITCPCQGYNIQHLKSSEAMVGQATIYIRPLHRNLSLHESDYSARHMIRCLGCARSFLPTEFWSHRNACGRAGPGSSPEQASTTAPVPVIVVGDETDAGEGCSYSAPNSHWKSVTDPVNAVKLFRESIMKNTGEMLHLRLDMRESNESRERSIIAFYKCHRDDWSAALMCSLEGDLAIGDGVNRHCLSLVMSKLQHGFEFKIGSTNVLLFEGEKDHLVPSASQVILDSDLFLVAGRIIGHCFLNEGPCLLGLSPAMIHVLVGGMPEMASIDVKDCCDTDIREAVELLKGNDELTEDQKRSIQRLAFGWDLPGVTQENRAWLMERLLFHAVIVRSKEQLKQIRRGLKETGLMNLLTERPDTIPLIFPRSSSVIYSPQRILSVIDWPVGGEEDDDDADEFVTVEDKCRIAGFLRTYIENATPECLLQLLKFWHGWEVLPTKLFVSVFSYRMPTSSTCTETLRLPVHHLNYASFQKDLDAAIGTVETGFGRI
ncbi:uncharacterized protein ACB058_013779 isoform 1-T2 [Synchiropus picturatus]